MKFLICVLFATFAVASAKNDIYQEEGHYHDHRPRTGHFNEYPFIDLYKNYVQVNTAPRYDGTLVHETDSYKNYAPAAEDCLSFFRTFESNGYALEKLEELVKLDACLGYLYDDVYVKTYHAIDNQRQSVKGELQKWIDDKNLRALYTGSTIKETLDADAKKCVANLLLRTVQLKHQYKSRACNNHHIELLNKFGDCHKTIPESLRETDTYIQILYDLIRLKGRECFMAEIDSTNAAIRHEHVTQKYYAKVGLRHIGKMINKWNKEVAQQTQRRLWVSQLQELFVAVQDLSGPYKTKGYNLREVYSLALAVFRRKDHPEDQQYVNVLLTNLGRYATRKINLEKVDERVQDEDGTMRYRGLVNKLCQYFRTTDSEEFYDFATSFARLVRMTEFPELYGISLDRFFRWIVNGREVSPTYASVIMCNIMANTQGRIVSDPKSANGNNKIYQVTFNANPHITQWPLPTYH